MDQSTDSHAAILKQQMKWKEHGWMNSETSGNPRNGYLDLHFGSGELGKVQKGASKGWRHSQVKWPEWGNPVERTLLLDFGYFISSQVRFEPFPMALFPAVISVLIVGPKADPVIQKPLCIRSFLTKYMYASNIDYTIGPETSTNSTFCYWLGDGEVWC